MKAYKRIVVIFFTAFFLCTTDNVKASHIDAGYITYSHVTGNTYQVSLFLYRDCNGISPPTTAIINYTSSCGGDSSVALTPVPGTGQIVTLSLIALPVVTSCTGGFALGIEEWEYTGLVTLPVNCSDWTFSFSTCCRSGSINTIVAAGSQSFYTETMLNNLLAPVNSSPAPISASVAEFCVGNAVGWNQGCFDADGDSLVYSLVCPKNSNSSFLSYNPPLSCVNPIDANPPVYLNPVSGQISFTPTLTQISIMTVRVDEFRNGALIGSFENNLLAYMVINDLCLFSADNNLIVGMNFIDANQNGICDPPEKMNMTSGVASVIGQTDTNYAPINDNGWFFCVVDTGNWTTSLGAYDSNFYAVNPSSMVSNFGSQTGQTDTVKFPVQLVPGHPNLCVDIVPVTPARRGLDVTYRIVATNVGTDSITGDLQFTHDGLLTLVSSIPAYNSYTNPIIIWNFTDFAPMTSLICDVKLNVPAPPTINIGDLLSSSVIINPVTTDVQPNNNFDDIRHEVIASFDPNDKWVEREIIYSNQIPFTEHLDYLIRFQNTGNDTAFLVIIRDTLDYQLDQSTLNILHSSHDYIAVKRINNVLEFQFNNILLPDSNVNEPASHAYIAYQIKPKSTFGVTDIIRNQAAIYFDYNAPILTNAVYTEAVMATGIGEVSSIKPLLVYPNPANGKITISAKGLSWSKAKISLYNTFGQLVLEENVSQKYNSEYTLDVHAFSKGLYHIVVVEGADNRYSSSIIIE
ncbi:MAG: T9SS type A sorting domain-containing protein [Bacteroidia bacterium]|nr:T9SS type A sorting domain-containing protein [Bacteroidia bacterium]